MPCSLPSINRKAAKAEPKIPMISNRGIEFPKKQCKETESKAHEHMEKKPGFNSRNASGHRRLSPRAECKHGTKLKPLNQLEKKQTAKFC
mmetsp:Transcript_28964/g.46719  ORF Transcript_28964/g.46719 Transcript_28964/m.46719 type:complete len:90 (+) Transcript_28964:360-629(+)